MKCLILKCLNKTIFLFDTNFIFLAFLSQYSACAERTFTSITWVTLAWVTLAWVTLAWVTLFSPFRKYLLFVLYDCLPFFWDQWWPSIEKGGKGCFGEPWVGNRACLSFAVRGELSLQNFCLTNSFEIYFLVSKE